jgi:hypothetical protein
MPVDRCTVRKRVSRIVVEENKRKATFVNGDKAWFKVTRVDGCLCCNEEAADFVITKERVGSVVVELKGRDVPHGVSQVLATAAFWRRQNPDCPSIAGLVVSRQRPSYSTSVQRAQTAFARTFQGPLHVVSCNKDFCIEEVLSFRRA